MSCLHTLYFVFYMIYCIGLQYWTEGHSQSLETRNEFGILILFQQINSKNEIKGKILKLQLYTFIFYFFWGMQGFI